jgi:hypothetical protein
MKQIYKRLDAVFDEKRGKWKFQQAATYLDIPERIIINNDIYSRYLQNGFD